MASEKAKKVGKVIRIVLLAILGAVILFTAVVFIVHRVKSSRELKLLKDGGYYNPVSVGDYSLNVAKFGNENGKHTIVGMAGLGMADYAPTARQMTACLEEDNLVVFVDRAGYGLSDDTKADMTLEYIVEDYRKALKNAGLEPPYILLPHSIGGAYATYWVSNFPDEIEAVVFIDGSELSADAFEEEEEHAVGFGDRCLSILAKLGFGRFVLRDSFYLLPDNFSDEEQELADALDLMLMESIAQVSEAGLIKRNAQDAFNGIITNDVPKLYICASWGFESWEEMQENIAYINRQIEKNGLDMPPREDIEDEAVRKAILEDYEKARTEVLFPYLEKLGNCRYEALPGDHMIYTQKPEECGKLVKDFIDELDQRQDAR